MESEFEECCTRGGDGQHDDLVLATALAAWYGESCWDYETRPMLPHVLGDT